MCNRQPIAQDSVSRSASLISNQQPMLPQKNSAVPTKTAGDLRSESTRSANTNMNMNPCTEDTMIRRNSEEENPDRDLASRDIEKVVQQRRFNAETTNKAHRQMVRDDEDAEDIWMNMLRKSDSNNHISAGRRRVKTRKRKSNTDHLNIIIDILKSKNKNKKAKKSAEEGVSFSSKERMLKRPFHNSSIARPA